MDTQHIKSVGGLWFMVMVRKERSGHVTISVQ